MEIISIYRHKRRLRAGILTLLCSALILAWCGGTWLQDAYAAPIAARVLRLHILAASDSGEDQANKLLVRDAVLELFSENLAPDADRDEAERWATENGDLILETATAVLREQGCGDSVSLTLSDCYFPLRAYGDLVFPCGVYRALRIVIGRGVGHNWWCVLSPGLCLDACSSEESLKEELSPGDYSRLTPEEETETTCRLWIVEMIQSVFS